MDAQAIRPALARDLQQAFAAHGPRVAIERGAYRLSYAELGHAVRRADRAMELHGIGADAVVASWSPNAVEPVVVHYAAVLRGACMVHVDPEWPGAQAADCLAGARATALFVRAFHQGIQYPALVKAARARLKDLRLVVTHGREPRFESLLPDGWAEFLHAGADAVQPPAVASVDAAAPPERIGLLAGLHLEHAVQLGPLAAHLAGHTLVLGDPDEPDALGWARAARCTQVVAARGARASETRGAAEAVDLRDGAGAARPWPAEAAAG
jgi:hypothetical protein